MHAWVCTEGEGLLKSLCRVLKTPEFAQDQPEVVVGRLVAGPKLYRASVVHYGFFLLPEGATATGDVVVQDRVVRGRARAPG